MMFSRPTTQSLFCEGCEFSGDIAPDGNNFHSTQRIVGDVRETVIFDDKFHMSHGIVSSVSPEYAPDADEIFDLLIRSRRKCVGRCVLEEANCVPIELSVEKKKKITEAMLNSFPGIKELGYVEFVDDEDDEVEQSDPVDSIQRS